MQKNIKTIERENFQLKTHLLLLIQDYKLLRNVVLNNTASSFRKRLYHELDPMNELISIMGDLSHDTQGHVTDSEFEDDVESPPKKHEKTEDVFSYINLDNEMLLKQIEEEGELPDEEVDEDIDSMALSRLTSPSGMSEIDENSLMTSLTRSTTVSTNTSFINSKPYKIHELPAFTSEMSPFTFANINPHDENMSIIQEDKYNSVTDFLEEKLLDNDVSYYVNQQRDAY